MMKRALCLLLSLLLLASCAFAEDPSEELKQGPAGDDSPLAQMQSLLGDAEDETEDKEEDAIFPVIAASGTLVWRISDGEIICADTASRQDTARLPVEDLFTDPSHAEALSAVGFSPDGEYEADFLSLVSRDDAGVRLLMAADGENDTIRVLLFDLALSGGQITAGALWDLTEKLGPFFGGDVDWLEIDVAGWGSDALLIAALDQDHLFRLYTFSLTGGDLKEIGSQSLMLYSASFPAGDSVLVAGFSLERESALDLTSIDPAGPSAVLAETIDLDGDPSMPANYALAPRDNTLYFTINATAYRVKLGSGEKPVPFAVMEKTPVMNRLGLVVGDLYVLYAEDGSLLYSDIHTELKAARIRVADATGDESLAEIASGWNMSQAVLRPNRSFMVSRGMISSASAICSQV